MGVAVVKILENSYACLSQNAYRKDRGILKGTLETPVDVKNGEGHTTEEEIDSDTCADLGHIFRQDS